MKKILACIALCMTSLAFGATLTPIQLISPAGSVAGQFITSTGPATPLAWSAVTLSGLGGLAKANNLSDLASASTARTNLGLGTAAVLSTGTSGATIPLLSTANTWAAAQTFSAAIVPSQTAGITGTTTNNSAAAGAVGETLTVSAAAIAQTSGTLTNVTSLSVTPGDWDITCTWSTSSATNITAANFGLSTTSAGQAPTGQRTLLSGISTASALELPCPTVAMKFATTTTVYLTSAPTFTGSMTVGGIITARRRR